MAALASIEDIKKIGELPKVFGWWERDLAGILPIDVFARLGGMLFFEDIELRIRQAMNAANHSPVGVPGLHQTRLGLRSDSAS